MIEMITAAIIICTVGVLGGSLASFLGVVAERSQKGLSITGRSECACGRKLRASENIPIVGWLLARGRTQCCDVPLPKRYVLTEAGLFLWFAGLSTIILLLIPGLIISVVILILALIGVFLTWFILQKTSNPANVVN